MSKSPLGRPSDRRNVIVKYLRDQIVDGRLRPGSQLPTRTEIEERFGAGPGTVQRALDSLVEDGFVEARGSRGTFVADSPPHLSRFALVFPSNPSEWHRCWQAMSNEAHKISASYSDRDLAFYYGVDGHSDSEDFQRLLRDIANKRVAGIIFTSPPHMLKNTPALDEPGIPRVAWATTSEFNVACVNTDSVSWLSRALDYLAERGRRRIAIIMPPTNDRTRDWIIPVRQRGFETHDYWMQSVHLRDSLNANNCAQLLMQCSVRPDGLIIADDNLVEQATAGLLASGVQVPGDLDVVAHCNFPWPTPSAVPVRRLGYDARHILHACLESLDQQSRGEPHAVMTQVPAIFEEEVRP